MKNFDNYAAPRENNDGAVLVGIDATDPTKVLPLEVNPLTGGLRIDPSMTPGVDYDYIDVQQTSATVETFVYKRGGSGGTTVQTVTVTYTDSSKNDIDSVVFA